MAKPQHPETKAMRAWRKAALAHPSTSETLVCNRTAFKAGTKSFFFMGAKEDSYNALLKLTDSIPEAKKLAAKNPDTYSVGKGGWVTVTLARTKAPPKGLVERWLKESFRNLAPKKLLA